MPMINRQVVVLFCELGSPVPQFVALSADAGWATMQGTFQNDNTTAVAHFSNGHTGNASVSADCSLFSWNDGSTWDASVPPSPACAAIASRAPCGQVWDSPASCLNKGCCWDSSGDGSIPCFYEAEAVNITQVHVIQVSEGVNSEMTRLQLYAAYLSWTTVYSHTVVPF